ncbi:hypothetical protein HDEF_1476 [Candidatus Hamiltonella defensa 5AT (Acyrthosiphon pisum)]|uniref:Uncharacterized protein n=1 Tax=Hamiltonella defensa subsp. Acyrthosiphon pisum (strain 5AT) TaxID=572265 RepID=C4K6A7_HAMD5|nr:hypothetical protein HDEF_1476 [Candidatus Hamiltonella defensa 5AT (Acyrthosiphon pisum)]
MIASGLILSLLLLITFNITLFMVNNKALFDKVHLHLFYLKKRQIKILLISTN